MSVRHCGWGMISANSVQETMDLALISYAATLETRVPFIHFFDGFRTSHEVMKIEQLSDDDFRSMISDELIAKLRLRALIPDHPVMRGTAQNPDVFFQAREAANKFYDAVPGIVQNVMDKFAKLTGRQYSLFQYMGAPDADRVIVLMGSGAETAQETVEYLSSKGEKVGILKIRLYRPFSIEHFVRALPSSVKKIAVLDRTKESGSTGEPLYLDVVTAFSETFSSGKTSLKSMPKVVGGRYGLSSKRVHAGDGQSCIR